MFQIIKAVLDYVKSFFIKPKQIQLRDIEAQLPYNPMDDLPPMNMKAEREFAFRIWKIDAFRVLKSMQAISHVTRLSLPL